MTQDLLLRMESLDFEDYGGLHVQTVEQRDEDVFLSLVLTNDEDPDLPENVRITCRAWRENTVVPRHYGSVYLTQDHVLLWDYNQPHVVASFKGQVPDPFVVMGALFERHNELVGKWVPFLKYLNPCMPLSELLRGSHGMLAEGPEPLVLAYAEVLANYGVSVSHHRYGRARDEKLSILILDDAYVIANDFVAEAI
jgi:hypothetical protein